MAHTLFSKQMSQKFSIILGAGVRRCLTTAFETH